MVAVVVNFKLDTHKCSINRPKTLTRLKFRVALLSSGKMRATFRDSMLIMALRFASRIWPNAKPLILDKIMRFFGTRYNCKDCLKYAYDQKALTWRVQLVEEQRQPAGANHFLSILMSRDRIGILFNIRTAIL